jgi:hypothetical protein
MDIGCEGDGWKVIKIEADRDTTVAAVKAQIKQAYDESMPRARCVFIFGHVPVPYSGELNPDGHPDHVGAWPTDTYYADMNGTWSDVSVNNTVANDSRNDNIPVTENLIKAYYPVMWNCKSVVSIFPTCPLLRQRRRSVEKLFK